MTFFVLIIVKEKGNKHLISLISNIFTLDIFIGNKKTNLDYIIIIFYQSVLGRIICFNSRSVSRPFTAQENTIVFI